MSADITRSTFNPAKRYSGVRQQQGRVSLDADWNEQVDIASYRVQTGALDTFGPSGAPQGNAGFGIGPLSEPAIFTDMAISPGRIYVDGILCELQSTPVPVILPPTKPAEGENVPVQLAGLIVDGQEFKPGDWVELSASGNTPPLHAQIVKDPNAKPRTLTLSPAAAGFIGNPGPQLRRITTYLTQPDLPSPDPLPTSGIAIAYLDVWERPITSLEDPEIRETALGSTVGADTTTRTRTIRQVRVQSVAKNTTCANAPLFDSSAFDVATRPSTARLMARAEPTANATSACILPPRAGFRRLENQLYRVEIHAGGDLATGAPSFKWSRDNGSVTTAVVATPSPLNGSTLTLQVASLGRDQVLNFAVGQFVELTDDVHELQNKPGPLVKLTGAFVGAQGSVLTVEIPSVVLTEVTDFLNTFSLSMNPKVRRWDQPNDGTNIQEGIWMDLESGVQVFFSPGERYRSGDYWLIPARTRTGDIDWPRDTGGNPQFQPAVGIRHHYCRLAMINFGGGFFNVIGDCRQLFPPLSEAGIHINNVFLQTGELLQNDSLITLKDLAGGISVACDTPIDVAALRSNTTPTAFRKPICFVSIDVPSSVAGQKPFASQPMIVSADLDVDSGDPSGNTILWAPTKEASTWLTETLASQATSGPMLAHLTLKGNFIWARDNPFLLLDGDTFGTPTPDGAGGQRTGLRLPSGDGRRGGDFEMWFWLISPSLVVSSTALDLGSPVVGTPSAAGTVTVTNSSNQNISFVSAVPAGEFARSGTTCAASPTPLPPGGTCTISIVFTPAQAGARSEILTITPDTPGVNAISVSLAGTGLAGGQLDVSPPSLFFLAPLHDFTEPQPVTVTNSGDLPVTINDISTRSNDYKISPDFVVTTLARGESLEFDVSFTPGQIGQRNAIVTITPAGGAPKSTVSLTGTATSPIHPGHLG